jgi:MFS transporter, SP family, general alpha glucoside:H+ symporter
VDAAADPPAFQHLVNLLRPFDDAFFAVWDGAAQQCDRAWLLEFEKRVREALPELLQVSNEQAANLLVTQLWLRIKLWELFPRFGFLSSAEVKDCLTFGYPIGVAREMAALGTRLPIESMRIHGVGMVS